MLSVTAISAGEISPAEAVAASLARIEAENPRLNAVTRVLAKARPGTGPLAGVPFSVKENIDLAGTPTTFGLLGDVPDAVLDAPHVAHLRAAGAVPVGRGNLPDLALRWHTESARYGVTVNPRDPALSPGGSSGGGAAAGAGGGGPHPGGEQRRGRGGGGGRDGPVRGRQRLRRLAARARGGLRRLRAAAHAGPLP